MLYGLSVGDAKRKIGSRKMASYASYRDKYEGLVGLARAKGLRVRLVKDRVTRDYIGMNPMAAKAIGFKIAPNTIEIDNNLTWKEKCHTLNHELIEYDLMKKKGWPYWKAHKKALKLEKKL
jgi:hypothetical protein